MSEPWGDGADAIKEEDASTVTSPTGLWTADLKAQVCKAPGLFGDRSDHMWTMGWSSGRKVMPTPPREGKATLNLLLSTYQKYWY